MRTAILANILFASALLGQGTPSPGFDAKAIDKSISPCVNFYQYSCGTWLKENPVPNDQSAWGRFSELAERNRTALRQVLEEAAAGRPAGDATAKQLGDFWASCMDEKGIESAGAKPLESELARIRAIKDMTGLAAEVARLHAAGTNVFFGFGSGQDFKDSSEVIAQADQAGLGLPERDYYTKTDAKSVETRDGYLKHLRKMFALLGESSERASAAADTVMKIETALAKGSQDVVTRRDPKTQYHRIALKDFENLTPSFDWAKYFADIQSPVLPTLNVVAPDFFKAMGDVLTGFSMVAIQDYLVWQYVHSEAHLLSTPFSAENFDFFSKTLTGVKEQRPRWKRCVSYADGDFGEALGKLYVEKTFPPEAKASTLKMVNQLEAALGQDIERLDWMTPETKLKAMEKLHAIANKIGYPEHFRDYSDIKVVRGDLVGDSDRASAFEFHRQIGKIGRPVDRLEWQMTPPTVNAYYDPQMNNINFPAGILQPPFFDAKLDDAVNFGAIGAVIGHELTHGFDDEGRQFDAKGNLKDWWTPKDSDAFDTRAQCIIDEYSKFTAVDELKVNGKLTLGENTADNGGMRIAYMALMEALGKRTPPKIDGFTAAQRFFLGWGQIWCENMRPEMSRLLTQTNPHAPAMPRVNGVVSNMPQFQEAFGCKEGQPMVAAKACRVW
jgi:endothelin-converting enzyme/putative endopeptidase